MEGWMEGGLSSLVSLCFCLYSFGLLLYCVAKTTLFCILWIVFCSVIGGESEEIYRHTHTHRERRESQVVYFRPDDVARLRGFDGGDDLHHSGLRVKG